MFHIKKGTVCASLELLLKVVQPQIFRTMSNSNMVNFLHQKAFIVGQMANLVNRCVSTKEIPKFSYVKNM